MDKIRDQKKNLIILGSLMSLVIFLFGGFYIYKTLSANTNVDKSHIQKDEFYSIRNNATELQRDLYEKLNEALEQNPRNNELISGLVAQNFVADFYTWSNKFRLNDVGGVQFVDENLRVNFYQKAQATLYEDMFYYLNKDGVKDTLEVDGVGIEEVELIDFFIFDEDGEEEMYDEVSGKYRMGDYHEAYSVVVSWTFVESDKVNVENYDSTATIILMINEKGVPMIVEVSHEEA